MGREEVTLSIVYRALKRHDWRKVVQNPKAPETFEKTKKIRGEVIVHGRKAPASLPVCQLLRLMFMDEARFGRISET